MIAPPCVLFADGAGAAVVRAAERGVIASTQGSDGTRGGAIYVKNRENYNPFVPEQKPRDYLYMDGGEVFKFAVKKCRSPFCRHWKQQI